MDDKNELKEKMISHLNRIGITEDDPNKYYTIFYINLRALYNTTPITAIKIVFPELNKKNIDISIYDVLNVISELKSPEYIRNIQNNMAVLKTIGKSALSKLITCELAFIDNPNKVNSTLQNIKKQLIGRKK